MSENNFNQTADDNVTKEKDLLMETNVNSLEIADNEALGSAQKKDMVEDKEKLVDISTNTIPISESKSENIEVSNVVENNDVNEKVNEENIQEDGSSFDKEISKVPDDANFDSFENKHAFESDQVLIDATEQAFSSGPATKIEEEVMNIASNEEPLIQIETSEHNEAAAVDGSKSSATDSNFGEKFDIQKDELQENQNSEESISGFLQQDNQEISKKMTSENLLNLTNEAETVEDETLLIRGLASVDDTDQPKNETEPSNEDIITVSNPASSARDELDAITSTPSSATQNHFILDPLDNSQAINDQEQLINVENLSQVECLPTTEIDKSLKIGTEEPSSSQTEGSLISQPKKAELSLPEVEQSESLTTNSEDKSSDLTQEPLENIVSNKDQVEFSEKNNTSVPKDEERQPTSSELSQMLHETNECGENSNQDFVSSEDQNTSQKNISDESSTSPLTLNDENGKEVFETGFAETNNQLLNLNQEKGKESILEDGDYQIEKGEENLLPLEKELPGSNLPISDYSTEESPISQDCQPCEVEKISAVKKKEENLESLNEHFDRSDISKPVVDEFTSHSVHYEESFEENQGKMSDIEEDNPRESSTQEEVLDNLQNQEKSVIYENQKSEETSKDFVDTLDTKYHELNDERVQTRLTDSENVNVSENLLEYTAEVASSILKSSQDEIAKKSLCKSFWSKEYQEYLRDNLSSLPAILFLSFIFISGVLGSAFEMSVIPFALLNVVAFLSIFIIYKCFLSC